ncbi:hypothetical protein [Anaerosolibacter sp.]|uniref:hypothetical protein n=1 Tax=Anaerosolibacter sp. TaxID=1872527 RepID=UPI0039EF57A1
MSKRKGIGLPIVGIVEGGHSIEEVQKSLAKKLSTISTKDFPSLEKLFISKSESEVSQWKSS